MYVGDPMVEFMSDLKEQAADWLSAYQQPDKIVAQVVAPSNDGWHDEPPPPEDDIPF